MWSTEELSGLPWIDFSKNSKVRNSLKEMLLAKRKEELSLEELDLVTAAGTGFSTKENGLSRE